MVTLVTIIQCYHALFHCVICGLVAGGGNHPGAGTHEHTQHLLPGPETSQHPLGRGGPREDLGPGTGVRLLQEEAVLVRGHSGLHGARSHPQDPLRLLGGLVLARVRHLQAGQGLLALQGQGADQEGGDRERHHQPRRRTSQSHERGTQTTTHR